MAAPEASPAKAGPSTQPRKHRRKRSASSKSTDSVTPQPPSKLSRIDDEGPDVAGGAGIDPMEALDASDNDESNGNAVDPMEDLEHQVEEIEAPVVPVRADEFEQEAERVIDSAKGLDGASADEGQVKLVHQVRHQVCWSSTTPRCVVSSRCWCKAD